MLEAACSRSVNLLLDLQRTRRFSLLIQPRIQKALDLTCEEVPAEWRDTRALPLLVARLLEKTMDGWSPALQLRMLST